MKSLFVFFQNTLLSSMPLHLFSGQGHKLEEKHGLPSVPLRLLSLIKDAA